MRSFFQIKIYRRKFIAYTLFVVIIGLALGIITCAVLLEQWVENARNEAAVAFARVRNDLQYNAERIETYMQRVYSNNSLKDDIQCFLGNRAEEYLTCRLQASKYNLPLASFPDDMKSFLGNRGMGDITQVSLHSGNYANVVRFDNNGNTSFQFLLDNADESFRETIHKGFVYRKKLSDATNSARQSGEIRFLVSSERIFKTVKSYGSFEAATVSASGEVYPITNGAHSTEEQFRQVVADGRSSGFLEWNPFKRVYFVTFHSAEFDYDFISTVDLVLLIRKKTDVLLIVFLIVLLAMISVLLLIIYNLREDANFIRRILVSIGRVKTADFIPMVTPSHYRRNEYGMIAREMDEMILKLNNHIRTEYLLKLKQQETEMKALQNQINPHFLYNTLEVIRSLALMNRPEDTADAIASLGALYRGIVKKENTISIHEELDLLQQFLKMMEFKFPERFYYQIHVDKAVLMIPTVKFWMQPLAENFFLHGFNSNNDFNLLVINGREKEDAFVIEFIDNGNRIAEERLVEIRHSLTGKEDSSGESIGLNNVYTRLHFFYGKGFSMKINNNKEAGIKITVIISKEALANVQTSDSR